MGALLDTPNRQKTTESGASKKNGLRYAVSSCQGWRRSMEDAHICNLEFMKTKNYEYIDSNKNYEYENSKLSNQNAKFNGQIPSNQGQIPLKIRKKKNKNFVALFGVYDGHGGPEISKYVSQRLPTILRQEKKRLDRIQKIYNVKRYNKKVEGYQKHLIENMEYCGNHLKDKRLSDSSDSEQGGGGQGTISTVSQSESGSGSASGPKSPTKTQANKSTSDSKDINSKPQQHLSGCNVIASGNLTLPIPLRRSSIYESESGSSESQMIPGSLDFNALCQLMEMESTQSLSQQTSLSKYDYLPESNSLQLGQPQLNATSTWPLALRRTYHLLDKEMIKFQEKSRNQGCTAITAVIDGSRLYLANCGDSRAIIGKNCGDSRAIIGKNQRIFSELWRQQVDYRQGDHQQQYYCNCGDRPRLRFRIIKLYIFLFFTLPGTHSGRIRIATHDHKPNSPRESNRITKAGGYVICINGQYRVCRNLNLSRALGDLQYKEAFIQDKGQMAVMEYDNERISDSDFSIEQCEALECLPTGCYSETNNPQSMKHMFVKNENNSTCVKGKFNYSNIDESDSPTTTTTTTTTCTSNSYTDHNSKLTTLSIPSHLQSDFSFSDDGSGTKSLVNNPTLQASIHEGPFSCCTAVSSHPCHPSNQIISGSPDVMTIELSENDEYLCLCCDGLWDVLSNEELLRFGQQKIREYCKRNGPGWQSKDNIREDGDTESEEESSQESEGQEGPGRVKKFAVNSSQIDSKTKSPPRRKRTTLEKNKLTNLTSVNNNMLLSDLSSTSRDSESDEPPDKDFENNTESEDSDANESNSHNHKSQPDLIQAAEGLMDRCCTEDLTSVVGTDNLSAIIIDLKELVRRKVIVPKQKLQMKKRSQLNKNENNENNNNSSNNNLTMNSNTGFSGRNSITSNNTNKVLNSQQSNSSKKPIKPNSLDFSEFIGGISNCISDPTNRSNSDSSQQSSTNISCFSQSTNSGRTVTSDSQSLNNLTGSTTVTSRESDSESDNHTRRSTLSDASDTAVCKSESDSKGPGTPGKLRSIQFIESSSDNDSKDRTQKFSFCLDLEKNRSIQDVSIYDIGEKDLIEFQSNLNNNSDSESEAGSERDGEGEREGGDVEFFKQHMKILKAAPKESGKVMYVSKL